MFMEFIVPQMAQQLATYSQQQQDRRTAYTAAKEIENQARLQQSAKMYKCQSCGGSRPDIASVRCPYCGS